MNPPFEVIVVGLHLRWNGVWQRPNHILARLAQRVPVVVLEEPVASTEEHDRVTVMSANVTVVTPHRISWTDCIDSRALDTVANIVGKREPLIWLYTPHMIALTDAYPSAQAVFDKMDDLTKFQGADPRIAERESLALGRCAPVFAGGRSLFASIRDRTRASRCYPSGVDVAHFEPAHRIRESRLQAREPKGQRPRLIYVGVIDERVDLGLIEHIARFRADWTITMVGPTAKIDPQLLPQLENIDYVGHRSYSELPEIFATADVGIMPFMLNDSTVSISPTKTLEYFAAGLPVVSTAVPDVVSDYADIVGIAHSPDEFIKEIDRALVPDSGRISRGSDRASKSDWDEIANAMWADVIALQLAAR